MSEKKWLQFFFSLNFFCCFGIQIFLQLVWSSYRSDAFLRSVWNAVGHLYGSSFYSKPVGNAGCAYVSVLFAQTCSNAEFVFFLLGFCNLFPVSSCCFKLNWLISVIFVFILNDFFFVYNLLWLNGNFAGFFQNWSLSN